MVIAREQDMIPMADAGIKVAQRLAFSTMSARKRHTLYSSRNLTTIMPRVSHISDNACIKSA